MSWWNAKYKNNHGEYEITFASKSYDKAKAVEKICQAVIDKRVKSKEDVEAVVRCENCKHWERNATTCGISNKGYCSCNEIDDMETDDFCSYGERKTE